jgi:hypothetical protein
MKDQPKERAMDEQTNEQTDQTKAENQAGANADPITGEHGSHPIGTGVGTAGGGLTGAAIGAAIGGPVGAAIGAVVGGVAGAYSGRGVAEMMHPTEDQESWRAHHSEQPWKEEPYEHYEPAYKAGFEAARRHAGAHYDQIEANVARDYEKNDANPAIPWDRARPAVRSAWHRVSGVTGPRDTDRGMRGGI